MFAVLEASIRRDVYEMMHPQPASSGGRDLVKRPEVDPARERRDFGVGGDGGAGSYHPGFPLAESLRIRGAGGGAGGDC